MCDLSEKSKVRTAQLTAAALCLAVCLFFFLFCAPFYVTDDDTVLNNIASGCYGEQYRTYLIFSNILYGSFLQLFYKITESINWYSIVPILFAIFGFVNVSLLITRELPNAWGVLLSSGFVLLFGRFVIVNFQFTVLASFFSAVGLFSMYAALFRHEKIYTYFSVSGLILAFLGFIIRFESFLSCAAVFAVCCLIRICRERFWKMEARSVLRSAAPFLVLLILAAGAFIYNGYVLSSNAELNYWFSFNDLRSKFLDFAVPEYSMYTDEFTALGIDELDYDALTNWNYCDLNKFSYDVFEQLALIQEQYVETLHQDFISVLGDFARKIQYILSIHSRFLIIIAVALFAAFRKKENLWLLLPFSIAGLEFFLLAYMNRFMFRAYVGLWMVIYLAAAIILCRNFSKSEKKMLNYNKKLIIVLALVMIAGIPELYQTVKIKERNINVNIEQAELSNWKAEVTADKASLYVYLPGFGSNYTIDFALPVRSDFEINEYELGGWDISAPFREEQLKRYGIPKDGFMRGLMDDSKNVYFLEYDDEDYRESLLEYLRKEYDENAEFELVNSIGNVDVIRFYAEPSAAVVSAEQTEKCFGLDNAVPDEDIEIMLKAEPESGDSGSFILSGYCGSEKIDPYIQRSWIKVTSGDGVQYFRGTKTPLPELAGDPDNLHAPAMGVVFEPDPSLFAPGRDFKAEIVLESRGTVISAEIDPELFSAAQGR